MNLQTLNHETEIDIDDRVKNIVAPCPGCGSERMFTKTVWMHSIKSERELQKLKKPEAVADAKCQSCKNRFSIREWQRSLETQEFRKLGWVTPRMMVS